MDLPFLLGTVATTDRRRAKAIGYLAHFGFGFLFATGHYAVFVALGRAGWLLGAVFGLAARPLRRHGPGQRPAALGAPPGWADP